MNLLTHARQLPGGDEARDFVGGDHGADSFFVDDSQVEGGEGDCSRFGTPSWLTAHRFINSGRDRLKLTAIHHAPRFATEWLEPLSPDQLLLVIGAG